MVLLFNLTINSDHLLQILDNLIDPGLGTIHTILGTLQVHHVAGNSWPGEGHSHTTKLIPNVLQHLSASGNKVLVELRVNGHCVLCDVIKFLDLLLQVFLSFLNSFSCS